MRFKILPKVDGFRMKGILYKPGDVVDLPESYAGESWLQQVKPEASVAAPAPMVESTAKTEEAEKNLENQHKKQRKNPKRQLKNDAR